MNNESLTPLVLLAIAVTLFFVFNNILHVGIHIGHTHDEEGMMGMMIDRTDGEVAGYEIHPRDVVEKIQRGEDIILLDVRTPEEYAEMHLENALLLPVQELSQPTLSQIGLGEDSKDKEIIIYCRSGARSKTAYDLMKSLGYTNIKSVAGGMHLWEENQYPFTESRM